MKPQHVHIAAGIVVASSLVATTCDSTNNVQPTDPTQPPVVVPMVNCLQSDQLLASPTGLYFGVFSTKTDPLTRTSILLTNTSQVTLIVVPGNALTTLQKTPAQNPRDPSNVLALGAFSQEGLLLSDPAVPLGVAHNQIYFVPPGFSVCGTVPVLGDVASVNIERDQVASVAWFVTKDAADAAIGKLLPADIEALTTCGNTAITLATSTPDFNALDVYKQALDASNSCYKTYKNFFVNAGTDDVAAETEASDGLGKVLDDLDHAPKLIQDIDFFTELIRR